MNYLPFNVQLQILGIKRHRMLGHEKEWLYLLCLSKMKGQIQDLKSKTPVSEPGSCGELPDILTEAHLLVVPSRWVLSVV